MIGGGAPPLNAVFYGLHGHRHFGSRVRPRCRKDGTWGVTRSARGSAMSFKSAASRRNLSRQQSTWLWDQQWSGNHHPRVGELPRGIEAPRAWRTGGAMTGALECKDASQPVRRATPPSSGVSRELAAGVTEPVRTPENAPRKARERAAVEQRVEADEALLESEPRRLTPCWTDTRGAGAGDCASWPLLTLMLAHRSP